MRGDPYWIWARFRSRCAACNAPVQPGSRIFYFPRSKRAFCNECGTKEAASFEAARFDEAMYKGSS